MTETNQNTLFEIPKDGYLAFDALSMKQLIIENLNKTGVFTDQNYEASYLSNIINVIAYSYNALMFYLNKTSSESLFSEAQIYENMNRIVKMLGYNPIGFQTSILPFFLKARNINQGLYMIPRYSYFIKNNIPYSFNEDIIFNKTTNNAVEDLIEVNNNKILFQGRFYEYPTLTSTGENNEIFTFNPGVNTSVDHFNIFVYRFNTERSLWEQWSPTENLFLEGPDAAKYEIRLNPEKRYEIKFGNNINGSKLNLNDKIAVYYLKSDGANGEISSNKLNNADYVRFNTIQFAQILADINTVNAKIITETSNLIITNSKPSSRSKTSETVDQIRESAPTLFKTQFRLVTSQDYKTYILNNFSNFIQDVHVSNNWEYISSQLKYYYNLGLTKPDRAGAPLFAQVKFADSCNFNNVYITMVPKTSISSLTIAPSLSVSQKQTIINSIEPRKTITTEIVVLDPVYIAVQIGVPSNTPISIQDVLNTRLLIVKSNTTRRTDDDIRADIVTIFQNTFNQNALKLGQTISLIDLRAEIAKIPGINQIYSTNIQTKARVPGISIYKYDPIYPSYIDPVTSEITSEKFQFLYYADLESLSTRIIFEENTNSFETIEI